MLTLQTNILMMAYDSLKDEEKAAVLIELDKVEKPIVVRKPKKHSTFICPDPRDLSKQFLLAYRAKRNNIPAQGKLA